MMRVCIHACSQNTATRIVLSHHIPHILTMPVGRWQSFLNDLSTKAEILRLNIDSGTSPTSEAFTSLANECATQLMATLSGIDKVPQQSGLDMLRILGSCHLPAVQRNMLIDAVNVRMKNAMSEHATDDHRLTNPEEQDAKNCVHLHYPHMYLLDTEWSSMTNTGIPTRLKCALAFLRRMRVPHPDETTKVNLCALIMALGDPAHVLDPCFQAVRVLPMKTMLTGQLKVERRKWYDVSSPIQIYPQTFDEYSRLYPDAKLLSFGDKSPGQPTIPIHALEQLFIRLPKRSSNSCCSIVPVVRRALAMGPQLQQAC